MTRASQLSEILQRIDGRGYKAYRDIQGTHVLGDLSLHVDRVQGDPFAAPSKLRLRVPQLRAQLPELLFSNRTRTIAFADHLARRVAEAIRRESPERRGSGKSGSVRIDSGGQEVLERSAVVVNPEFVEARIEVGLPAAGRRVLGRAAESLLCRILPRIAERALWWANLDAEEAHRFVECIENQESIRARLDDLGLIAFVGDGARLPRESGASDRPLGHDTIPFDSPDSMRVQIPLCNPIEGPEGPLTELSGLGIPRGVTVIVGGGYHGKSTLLRAIERGIYPHVPGDGREWVVSDPRLVKVRAEDGRRVEQVDIQAFISDLPQGRATDAFSSDDASGSTSQAANIVEAIEAGARGLLLDEDTSATNFMVRDARMQALVHKRHEPITPFLERVGELAERLGVSTLLVMGGVGDYFAVADHVIMMREFSPFDVSAEAKRIAAEPGDARRVETTAPLRGVTHRVPLSRSFDPSRGRRDVKIDARAIDTILYGSDPIDLRFVEQLVDRSQTRAVGLAIHLAAERFMDGQASLAEILDRLDAFIDERGLDELDPFHQPDHHPGDLARPRRFEVAAAMNRLRTLRVRQRRNDRD
jgi:predicted ABC-class ATPase